MLKLYFITYYEESWFEVAESSEQALKQRKEKYLQETRTLCIDMIKGENWKDMYDSYEEGKENMKDLYEYCRNRADNFSCIEINKIDGHKIKVI